MLSFSLTASAQTSVSGRTQPAPSPGDKPAAKLTITERAAKGDAPLSRKYASIKMETAAAFRLPAPTASELQQRPSRKKLRVGITRPFTQTQNPLAESTGYPLAEGRVNMFRVASEGAVQIRLQFTQFNLPAGARLFVYAANSPDEFYGPYQNNGPDGNGSFWTPPIRGEEIVVEYFTPESAAKVTDTTPPFRVANVSHIFTDPQNRAALQANADCQLAIPAEWSETAKSTGLLQFTLPDGEYLCTGTLLNNTANGNDPYLLTANHCFSTRPGASSLKVYWLYDSANQDPTSRPANYGSRLLATGEANDFTLVRLNQTVPAGVRYAGWTTEKPATAVPVTAIHHPEGEHKRIAFGKTIEKNCNTSFGIPCDNLLKVQWDSGVTAPGSSGSGLFVNSAADAKLVGTLIGGASACDNRTGVDYYTRFDQIFPAISYFLAGSGCHYTLSQQRQFAAAAGSAGSIDVFPLAGAKCAWTASSTVSWIKVTTNSGSGEGTVKYTVDPNTASGRRAGLLTIAGHSVLINQLGTNEACEATPIELGQTINGTLSPGACRSILDDSALAVRYTFQASAGQQMAVNLDSTAFDAYLVLLGPDGEKIAEDDDSGPGINARIPAPTTYAVDSTNYITLLATGTYTIEVTSPDENPAGSFSMKLEKSCSYTMAPNKFLAGASGIEVNGALEFNPAVEVEIKGDSACRFFIESDDPWLHTSASGNFTTGKGQTRFSIDGNNTAKPRAALFYVAGLPVFVKQAAYCGDANQPTISRTSDHYPAVGGKGTINVTLPQGEWCTWNVTADGANVITPPHYLPSATGDGQVEFSVGALTGLKPRVGKITISKQMFTFTQEESIRNCPPAPIVFGQPVSGTLGVGDCHWRPDADSIADLYTFDGAAGQQIAINLSSPDTPVYFTLFGPAKDPVVDSSSFFNQTEIRFPREGYYDLPATGNYILLVSSGTGNQAGNYSVKVETVGGPNCVYNLAAPDEQTIPAEGGMGIVKLFATDGCSWNITSTADWVTFPQGFSGKGGRNISFTVAANTGAERRATLTVGGRYFRILQQAPCSYVKIRTEDGKVYGSYKGSTVTISVETGQGCQFPAVSKTDWIKLYSLQSSQALFNLEANNGPFRKGTVEVAGQTIEVQQGGTGVTVVSSADYSASVAAGGIVTVFGEGMSVDTATATSLPLQEYLAATYVRVSSGALSIACPLFYVSPTQINFQIPENVPAGVAQIEPTNFLGLNSFGTIKIERVAPSLFTANATGQGVAAAVALRVKADGTQVYEPVATFDAAQNKFIARPLDVSDPAEQVFLILFGTGLRNNSALGAITAKVGGTDVNKFFAGAQGGFVGLDQVNLQLPQSLSGRGEVDVVLTFDGKTANTVKVNIK